MSRVTLVARVARAALLLAALALPSASSAAPAPAKPKAKAASAKPVLPWVEDDYARALGDAKARKLPMFVESWAPW
jgi:hypothetical protein